MGGPAFVCRKLDRKLRVPLTVQLVDTGFTLTLADPSEGLVCSFVRVDFDDTFDAVQDLVQLFEPL